MASIHNDVPLPASARDVWDAVRDFGALHQRLVYAIDNVIFLTEACPQQP